MNAGKMPVNNIGRGVVIKLIANVNQMLYGCDINIINRGEVKDDGFEGGTGIVDVYLPAATWSGIVPRSVLA